MFNLEYLSSGHTVFFVSKDVRIRGYFSKQKKFGQHWYEVWLLAHAQLLGNKNKLILRFCFGIKQSCGRGSLVGIATELRTGRSGIESRWGRDFPPVQTGPGAHPASCKMGIGSFPGVKCGRGMLLTTHPLLVPLSLKSRAIPLPTLWATPGL